jgi:two-component system nitrogen regulation response regulator GlnG
VREQFQVRSFASAREVLAALDTDEPQVLVSDIRMPGSVGHRPAGQGEGAAAGAAGDHHDRLFRPRQRGVGLPGRGFEYLPKPFDLPKAVELIRRAVEESLREEVGDTAPRRRPRCWARRRRCRTCSAPSGG